MARTTEKHNTPKVTLIGVCAFIWPPPYRTCHMLGLVRPLPSAQTRRWRPVRSNKGLALIWRSAPCRCTGSLQFRAAPKPEWSLVAR